MHNILVTGAASRIGEAASILIAKELKPETMILTDKPGANLNKVASEILETKGCTHIECLYIDLADEDCSKRWQELPSKISGLVLCAAAGLAPGVTREQIDRINLWSQVALAEEVFYHRFSPDGCHGVFINSLWGHNIRRKFPHEAYEPIADDKHRAEYTYRLLSRRLNALHTFNIVVSSMVARTFASILVHRELPKISPDALPKLIESLPEHREVTIAEAAQGILAALKLEQTGQTVWVPPSGSEEWAMPEMLALSSN